MSTGGIIGGVVGGIIGFIIQPYNPAAWAMGFSIGMGVGTMIDPIRPDVPSVGQPDLDDKDISTAEEGDPIVDFLGTQKLKGNIFLHWGERVEEIKQDVGGKGGGGSSVVTGYKYYMSWCQAFAYGPDPADAVYTMFFDNEIVWAGNLQRPGSGGEETITLGGEFKTELNNGQDSTIIGLSVLDVGGGQLLVDGDPYGSIGWDDYTVTSSKIIIGYIDEHEDPQGYNVSSYSYDSEFDRTTINGSFPSRDIYEGANVSVQIFYNYNYSTTYATEELGDATIYFGTADQMPNSLVAEQVGADKASGYRGLFYIVFDDIYVGGTNRLPNVRVVARKSPALAFSALHEIETYDYNGAHAIWYILEKHIGMSASMLNADEFAEAANIISSEGIGISLTINSYHSAMNYLESILDHIGGIIVYSQEPDSSG